MKPEIKERWVGALRSGAYEQGRGVLRGSEGYCCLGVLCELAAEDGIVEIVEAELDERLFDTYEPEERPTHAYKEPNGDSETFYLPTAVQEWADVEFNPSIDWNAESETDKLSQFRYLSTLNDQGKTFKEISDLIEEYL